MTSGEARSILLGKLVLAGCLALIFFLLVMASIKQQKRHADDIREWSDVVRRLQGRNYRSEERAFFLELDLMRREHPEDLPE